MGRLLDRGLTAIERRGGGGGREELIREITVTLNKHRASLR